MSGDRTQEVRPVRNAYRAAGQAVAAMIVGAPLINASTDGVKIGWTGSEDDRPKSDVLADILIGLTGVTMRSRYCFGFGEPGCCIVRWAFDESDLHDWAIARELLAKVDERDEQDLLYSLWEYARDLADSEEIWSVVEAVAGKLQEGVMGPDQVMSSCVEAAEAAQRRIADRGR